MGDFASPVREAGFAIMASQAVAKVLARPRHDDPLPARLAVFAALPAVIDSAPQAARPPALLAAQLELKIVHYGVGRQPVPELPETVRGPDHPAAVAIDNHDPTRLSAKEPHQTTQPQSTPHPQP